MIEVSSFQPALLPKSLTFIARTPKPSACFSSMWPPSDNGSDKSGWEEFLYPSKPESKKSQRTREYLSENSLPISYMTRSDDKALDTKKRNGTTTAAKNDAEKSIAFVQSTGVHELLNSKPPENNPYVAVVSRLTPSELISRFIQTAHPRVQTAVRTTILGLIGGLPRRAFDTTTITTGQRLASLMFQLQMTGYMFKNADYKLSMQQALGVEEMKKEGGVSIMIGNQPLDPLRGKIRGKLRISSPNTKEGIEVDAAAYMSELHSEISQLRHDLLRRESSKEALHNDLLLYIRTLPEKELQSLTDTMSQDVLVAMKGLVGAVITGVGEGKIEADTLTEQSGEAMTQLCMWQLAIGYNLRTLEVREELKQSSLAFDGNVTCSGLDLSQPGAFE